MPWVMMLHLHGKMLVDDREKRLDPFPVKMGGVQ
jgi:hypothetical protein